MPSVVLEGGTFRPIFTAGVLDALLDFNIEFDYVVGVSAGIVNGFSYVSKQKGRNLRVLLNYREDKRYISANNLLKNRSLFGLKFVFDTIPNELDKYDYSALRDYNGRVVVAVTNAESGKIEYMDGKQLDHTNNLLKATCAIPLVFPAITLNGKKYFDGGLKDPIPLRKSIADGNNKHLVILTRPKNYRKELSKQVKITASIVKNIYPKLEKVLLERHLSYNDTLDFVQELEGDDVVVIRPEYNLESFEKNKNKIVENYLHGYQLAVDNIDKIRKIFEEEE